MTIHIYNQNCLRAGQVAPEESGDTHEWTGTEAELIARASDRLTKRFDTRAGGADDSFEWKCAMAVLRELGAELPEFDSERGHYVFAVEADR